MSVNKHVRRIAGGVGDVAHEAVLNGRALGAGALHGVLDGMGGHGHDGRHIETATPRLGQARAGVGNHNSFAHLKSSSR